MSMRFSRLWLPSALRAGRSFLFMSIAVVALSAIGYWVFDSLTEPPRVSYSVFLDRVEAGEVVEVTIDQARITCHSPTHGEFLVYVPPDPNLIGALRENGVGITALPTYGTNLFFPLLSLLALGLIAVIAYWSIAELQRQKNPTKGVTSSPWRLLGEDQVNTTFADVGGLDEQKRVLGRLAEFLRDPARYQRLGGRPQQFVLLVGPNGCGKTLIAKALCGEAKVPFFKTTGSEFVDTYVGVGAGRVRNLFNQAKRQAPCIVFIDAIDEIGRARETEKDSASGERSQTMQQLLAEMSECEESGVILVAATDRPDLLDPAFLQDTRFGTPIVINEPDLRAREQILKIRMRRVPLDDDVKPSELARCTAGYTGAGLTELVNDAAILAAEKGKRTVGMRAFFGALTQRRNSMRSPLGEDAGSDQVETYQPARNGVYLAGRVLVAKHLGVLSEENTVALVSHRDARTEYEVPTAASKSEIEDRISIALAGRAAEKVRGKGDAETKIGEDDLRFATELAEKYVKEWGFGETLQTRTLATSPGGKTAEHETPPELLRRVEREISDLLAKQLARAESILLEDRAGHALLCDALVRFGFLPVHIIPGLLVEGTSESVTRELLYYNGAVEDELTESGAERTVE